MKLALFPSKVAFHEENQAWGTDKIDVDGYTLWRNRVRWLSVLPFFIFQFLWRYVIYASHTVFADSGHKRALNWMFLSYFGAWVSQRPFWGVGFAVCGPIPSPRQGDRPGTYQIRARRCKYRCEDTSRTHKVIHTCACIYRTFANLSSVYLSLKSSQIFQFIHTQLSKSFTQHSRFCSFGHVKYFCRSYTMMANMQSGLKFIVPMIKLLRWHMKLVDCLITASTGHFLHL